MFLNLFNKNTEALELLDWSQIIQDISSLAHFDLVKIKYSTPPAKRSLQEIEFELNTLEKYLLAFDDYSLAFNTKVRFIPSGSEQFQYIVDLSKGKQFEANELNFFGLLIEAYIDQYKTFSNLPLSEDFSFIIQDLNNIKRFFLNPLRDFVDKNGHVSYERHPLLKKHNEELNFLEADLRNSINRLSRSEPYNSRLQMDTYDIVNDRYVLAIRSDSYVGDLGPIISRSQSGQTLFVEPFELKDKSNRRMRLLAEIDSIILKLTIDLSAVLFQNLGHFEKLARFYLELDCLNSKATYTIKLGLTKPRLATQFKFDFQGLFHPLILNPIKNNIEISTKHRGLIISGPNTGGKTVALKSMALSILFLNMGLYAPASYAEIYPVDGLFYFSHDHQNLKEGLSSFASEAKYYIELLSLLESKNLIIIDEIFNSTSSEEASALALSLLDEIHARSSSIVLLSTHHQVLKTFMHTRNDYISAHVGFDFEKNRPTYKLITGEPGSSLAFKIFDNLSSTYGLKSSISEHAKSFLDQKQLSYEGLLLELSSKKIDLDKLLHLNKQLNVDLKNQKSSMEGVLFLEKERLFQDYSQKLKKVLDNADELIANIKNEKIVSKKIINEKQALLNKEMNSHASEKIIPEEVTETYAHLRPLHLSDMQIPMTVFSISLRKNVTALTINYKKKEVQITHGRISIWVSINTLRWPSGSKIPKASVSVHINKTIRGEIELHCLGMRLPEFIEKCEHAIGEVINGDIPFVTIIHGHGNGVLKNWLRQYLKNQKDLRYDNNEGNDGSTKIYLI